MRESNQKYFLVEKALVQNKNITYEAVGVWLYITSLPEDVEISVSLIRRPGMNAYQCKAILDELITAGYLKLAEGE